MKSTSQFSFPLPSIIGTVSVMSDDLRDAFWQKYDLTELTRSEWEALCDGCGKCCLLKLEDYDTAEVEYTNVACRLLDRDTCQCSKYAIRKQIVTDCIVVDAEALERISYWLPTTCAYRLLAEGQPLPEWHHLVCGDRQAVHAAGISLRGRMVSEETVDEDDLEDHVVEGVQ